MKLQKLAVLKNVVGSCRRGLDVTTHDMISTDDFCSYALILGETFTHSLVLATSSTHSTMFLQYISRDVLDWHGYTLWPLWMYKATVKCKHQSEFTDLKGLGEEMRTSARRNLSARGQKQPVCLFEQILAKRWHHSPFHTWLIKITLRKTEFYIISYHHPVT